MTDICIYHAPDDATVAKELANALTASGWSVLLPSILSPKVTSNTEVETKLERQCATAQCVVVLWSRNLASSSRAIEIAKTAMARKVLVNAFIENLHPHMPFLSSGLDEAPEVILVGWSGRMDNKLATLMDTICSVAPALQPRIASPQSLPRKSIFLCYRPDDTQGDAGRLHDGLTAVFGDGAVFMDVDSIPYGVDFVDHINAQLASCAVMVVVIGRSWLTTDQRGRRRLDLTNDLVRGEIAEGLRRQMAVIPVLVQNAAMPDPEELPDDIRALTRRNAIELSHSRWKYDVERLVGAVRKFLPS